MTTTSIGARLTPTRPSRCFPEWLNRDDSDGEIIYIFLAFFSFLLQSHQTTPNCSVVRERKRWLKGNLVVPVCIISLVVSVFFPVLNRCICFPSRCPPRRPSSFNPNLSLSFSLLSSKSFTLPFFAVWRSVPPPQPAHRRSPRRSAPLSSP